MSLIKTDLVRFPLSKIKSAIFIVLAVFSVAIGVAAAYPRPVLAQTTASSGPISDWEPVNIRGSEPATTTAESLGQVAGTSTSASSENGASGAIKGMITLVNLVIRAILTLINKVIFVIFTTLIAPFLEAMLSIHTYSDKFVSIIYPGWQIVRNLSNMVFIIALIAIAMGTLFQMSNYQFRQLLIKLVIAALLVNFSLVIGQAVLGLADTIQNQFLPNNSEAIRTLARDLMERGTVEIFNNVPVTTDPFSVAANLLFMEMVTLGTFAVFVAMVAFLAIRVIALWILLMVSPLAYVAGVLPTTAGLRGKWWSEFLKYAFFTPIMAFFINLVAMMNKAYGGGQLLGQLISNPVTNSAIANFFLQISSNILLVVFLFYSLKWAEGAGVFGSAAISKVAQKGFWAPMNVSRAGLNAGYNKTKEGLNTARMKAATALGSPGAGGKKPNMFARAASYTLGYPESAKAKKEAKEKKLHDLQHDLQAVRSDALVASQGGHPHERLHNIDHRKDDKVKASPFFNGATSAHGFDAAQDDPKLSKVDRMAAQAAEFEKTVDGDDVEGFLKSKGYAPTREGYVQFANDLTTKYGWDQDYAKHYLAKMDSKFKKNNQLNYVGVVDTESHNMDMVSMTNIPAQIEGTNMLEGQEEFERIQKLPFDQRKGAADALSGDEQQRYAKYKNFFDAQRNYDRIDKGQIQEKDLSDAERANMAAYKPYLKMVNGQYKARAKKGTRALVADVPANVYYAKDKSGKLIVTDQAAELLTTGGEDLYRQSGAVSEAHKLAYDKIIHEKGGAKKMEDAFTTAIYRQQQMEGKDDIKLARTQARQKVTEVSKNLYNTAISYSEDTGTWSEPVKLVSQTKSLQDVVKEDTNLNRHFSGLEQKDANRVVQYYSSGWNEPERFKSGLSESMVKMREGLKTDEERASFDNLVDGIKDQQAQAFAGRFQPQQLSQPGREVVMDGGQLQETSQAIQTSFRTVMDANPNLEMRDYRDQVADQLRSNLTNVSYTVKETGEVKTLGEDPAEMEKVVNVVMAGVEQREPVAGATAAATTRTQTTTQTTATQTRESTITTPPGTFTNAARDTELRQEALRTANASFDSVSRPAPATPSTTTTTTTRVVQEPAGAPPVTRVEVNTAATPSASNPVEVNVSAPQTTTRTASAPSTPATPSQPGPSPIVAPPGTFGRQRDETLRQDAMNAARRGSGPRSNRPSPGMPGQPPAPPAGGGVSA